ncbi:MAG: SDR family oxidoreductase, partial [Rhizobiales bacterium]|nr:SDR family oxidoreductase [Hyphomicrobiales bacterium]
IALITGGARGLGLAIAERFAAEGAHGLLLDLPEPINRAKAPGGFQFIAGDVTDESAIKSAVARAAEIFGKLDIVIGNAGVVPPWRETEALDLAEWDRVMAINARGMAATIKHAVPALRASQGTIVLMASINAYAPHANQMVYTASKHAVLGIARAAAQDLGRFGIRVNAVAPGPIATEALLARVDKRTGGGEAMARALDRMSEGTALRRLASADEVAKAVLFLASDLSSGITGEMLPVNAGQA